jgi:hypothetical protein
LAKFLNEKNIEIQPRLFSSIIGTMEHSPMYKEIIRSIDRVHTQS